jgi:hypothetical protein
MTNYQIPPQTKLPEGLEDHVARLIVKLMSDLDFVIMALRSTVPPKQAWQCRLLEMLVDADRQMQILRMMELMSRTDADIAAAGMQLGATCRQIGLAIQGSRADGTVKGMAKLISRIGVELPKLFESAL